MTKQEFTDWFEHYFGHLSVQDKTDILAMMVSCTSFPFAGDDYDMYKNQLSKYHSLSDGTAHGMMCLAEKALDEAMEKANECNPPN